MKAEDTVMGKEAILECIVGLNPYAMHRPNAVARKQAEISFSAGFKYALEGTVIKGGYESVKLVGIREVVELGEVLGNGSFVRIDIPMTKLKEWGL